MSKVAVVLFNLGGPDSREAIRPFLKNFFMDKNIIQAPLPVRMMVSSLIANRRSGKEAGTSYGHLGYKSPLLENTQAQAAALQAALNHHTGSEYKVFIAMRYWHPMSAETAQAVKAWTPERVVLLPLYPQFSTTTTGSSYQAWTRAAKDVGLAAPTTLLGCYFDDPGFVAASARLVREAYENFSRAQGGRRPRVLFSAHGLPEKIIAQGDPYQWQCERNAAAIAAATGIADLDWQICYQSRVGPLKWIGPSTEDALQRAAADQVPVLIYPHAFVSEHVETLVEIGMEYRHLAETLGIPGFERVPTVSVAAEFIGGLARMVVDNGDGGRIVCPVGQTCPAQFGKCCQQQIRKAA